MGCCDAELSSKVWGPLHPAESLSLRVRQPQAKRGRRNGQNMPLAWRLAAVYTDAAIMLPLGGLMAASHRFLCFTFALFFLALPLRAQSGTCSGMSLGQGASLNGFVPFPSDNLWNTDISNAMVDPN